MPVYEYECPRCGTFQDFRLLEARDAPTACPDCGRSAARIVSAPNLALMDGGRRKAHSINERNQHEPRVGSKHACSAGCGCGRPAGRTAERPLNRGRKAPKRPWMLGHG